MAELISYMGPLGSGKSGRLITKHQDLERLGLHSLVMKPALDTKTGERVGSRTGLQIYPDFLIPPDMTGEQLQQEIINRKHKFWEQDFADVNTVRRDLGRNALSAGLKAILMDEAQFLTPEQVNALYLVAVKHDVPVNCYGIATDFRGQSFEGSNRLQALSQHTYEMRGVCRCGADTEFNARLEHGKFVFEGDPIAMDGQDGVSYESLCGSCFLDEGGEVVLSLR